MNATSSPRIRVGTRDSRLAVAQTELVLAAVRARHPEMEFETVPMKTTGDRILDQSLDAVGGKGLFVKELEQALLDGRVDICVHSYKDLPVPGNPDLPILAVLPRGDARDVLVLADRTKPLGTSSLRRRHQLAALYPDWECAPVRGNVQTRLRKLDSGEFGGLVLAAAGMERLGLAARVTKTFTPDEVLPSACQGILAVQGRRGSEYPWLKSVHSPETWDASVAERAFVAALGASCASPVAAYAVVSGDTLMLSGLYVDDGGRIRRGSVTGFRRDAERVGRDLAQSMRAGFVTLVGAGPGDPGLLTLAGREAILAADVVLFDRLVGDGILALIPKSAERVDVGKCKGSHPVPQEEINRLLCEYASRGLRVVRLKGGDPYVFGRGAEELDGLVGQGIPFRVVPGVTSAVAAPAYAGIPVTHRDFSSSLHIITGHGKEGRKPDIPYAELARLKGTLVFLMGTGMLPELCRGLTDAGMPADTPAALVENGTRPDQRRLVATLGDIVRRAEEEGIAPPAVFIVGAVCGLAARYDWTEQLPLRGRKILAVCREETAGRLAAALRGYGCAVDEWAAIETEAIRQPDEFWDGLSGFDWIVFTSPFGAETFFEQLRARKQDARAVAHMRFAVAGRRTAEVLEGYGIVADYVPGEFSSRALGDGFPGDNALLFRARDASGELPDRLRTRGLSFREVVAYETRPRPLDAGVRMADYDAAAFTSASAVGAFAAAVRVHFPAEESGRVRAFCIGDATASAASRLGMRVFTSPVADIPGMAGFIAEQMKTLGEPNA